MSLKYIDQNGASHVVSGMTPGGNLETGAVATREGTAVMGSISPNTAASQQIEFVEALPDADYCVFTDSGGAGSLVIDVHSQTVDGFRLNVLNLNSGITISPNIKWKAFKLYEVADAEALYSTVQDMQKAFPADASSSNKLATIHDVTGETRSLDRRLDDVEDVIPNSATIVNKLATAEDVAEAMANAGLKVTDSFPTSPQDGDVILYIGADPGYSKGGIYQYATATNTWTLISTADIDVDNAISSTSENPVQNKVIKAELDKKQSNIFIGTTAAWKALSAADKAKYNLVSLTDDSYGKDSVIDAVVDGEVRPVTSNAVYDLVNEIDTATVTATEGTGTLVFKKTGKVVSVYGYIEGLPTGTDILIGTCPVGYRPINSYGVSSTLNTSSPYLPNGSIWIYSTGNIRIYKTSTETKCYVFVAYVTA